MRDVATNVNVNLAAGFAVASIQHLTLLGSVPKRPRRATPERNGANVMRKISACSSATTSTQSRIVVVPTKMA